MLDWERQGWLTLCEEREIPRASVHDVIKTDSEEFKKLKYFGFDRALMCQTVGYCQDDLGLEPIEVAQGVMSLNSPSKALESMVISGVLDTSGDPVMDWMIQNVSVKPDNNGNIKPLKTVGGVRKHIDGVIALVQAIYASASNPPPAESFFDTEWNL